MTGKIKINTNDEKQIKTFNNIRRNKLSELRRRACTFPADWYLLQYPVVLIFWDVKSNLTPLS